MKLTKEAMAAISAAVQGAATASPMEILKHVLLVNQAAGFQVVGGNGQLQITAWADRLDGADFMVCVPADRMSKILGFAGRDVDISVTEKLMAVRAGSSRFSLPLYTIGEYPVMPEAKIENEVVVPAEALRSALDRVLPLAADADVGRPYLVSLILEKKDGALWFVATDGGGLAWQRTPIEDADDKGFFAFIHQHTCRKLKGLLSGVDQVVVGMGDRLKITMGNITLEASGLNFSRLEWRRALRTDHTSSLSVRAGEAAEIIGAAMIVAEEAKIGIVGQLEFLDDGIRVKSGKEDVGGYEGMIPCIASPGSKWDAKFNLRAIREVFGSFPKDEEVFVSFRNAQEAICFASPKDPDFNVVYMPLRY